MKLIVYAANTYAAATQCIIDKLKQNDSADLKANHIVISSERTSMTSELEILDALGGSFNTSVMTFAKLTSKIMKEKKFISKQSAIMLLSKITEEVKTELRCFKRAYDTDGFAANIYETISQFKYSSIPPEMIEPENYEPNLKLKMYDIKLIYQKYEDFLKGNYIDSGAKLQLLISAAPDSELIKNSDFFITDFDNFSVQEALIVRQLIIHSKGVYVAATYSKTKNVYTNEIFNTSLNLAQGLDISPEVQFIVDNQSNFVAHIEDNLFLYKSDFKKREAKDSELALNRESNIFDEVESVAKYISDKINEGNRFKDFLIVAGDVDSYGYAIEQIFPKYKIAFFLDKKLSLYDHALSRYLFGLLKAVRNNFRSADVFALIKNHFYFGNENFIESSKNNFRFEKEDIYAFENFCLKNNAQYCGAPFKFKSVENDAMEQIRKSIVQHIESFGFKSADTVENFVKGVRMFLNNEKIIDKFAELYDNQQKVDLPSSKVSGQVYDKFQTLLDTLNDLFGKDWLTAEQFETILERGATAESISIIPLYNDCVVVTNLSKARTNANKNLIVIGAGEGTFPVVHSDTKLLADSDIENLKKSGVIITPKIESENKKELFNIYQLLICPRASLYMSYAQKSEASVPCRAFDEISRMFMRLNKELPIQYLPKKENYTYRQARECFTTNAAAYHSGKSMDIEKMSALYYGLEDDSIIDSVYVEKPKINLSRGKEALLPKDKTSVTKLEGFYRCPYSYFFAEGLKLKVRETGELRVMDTGTILHEVLEKYVAGFDEKESDKTTDKNVEDIIASVLNRAEYEFLKNKAKLKFSVLRMTKEAQAVCRAVKKQIANSSFKPKHLEEAFGFDNCGMSAIEIDSVGGLIKLTGKIDRIDETEDKFILIDYKTGQVKYNETALYAGQKLQLLTYVKTAMRFLNKKCAGFFYMKIHNNFTSENSDSYGFCGRVLSDMQTVYQIDNAAEKSGYSEVLGATLKNGKFNANTKINITEEQLESCLAYTDAMIENAVSEITSGFIGCRPFENACEFCDFSEICSYSDLTGNELYGVECSVSIDDIVEVMK